MRKIFFIGLVSFIFWILVFTNMTMSAGEEELILNSAKVSYEDNEGPQETFSNQVITRIVIPATANQKVYEEPINNDTQVQEQNVNPADNSSPQEKNQSTHGDSGEKAKVSDQKQDANTKISRIEKPIQEVKSATSEKKDISRFLLFLGPIIMGILIVSILLIRSFRQKTI